MSMDRDYRLTQAELDDLIDSIEQTHNIQVKDYREIEDGYVFLGKFGFTIGDIRYNPRTGQYNPFNFHYGVKEAIEEKVKKIAAGSRNFALQKVKTIGISFTVGALVSLAAIGLFGHHNPTPPVDEPVVVEQVVNIRDANDILLVNWSNYAIGEVRESTASSEYDGLRALGDTYYSGYFVPVMSSYYNYLEAVDEALPPEIGDGYIERTRQKFREAAYEFDRELGSTYFSDAKFSNSPFAHAIIIDDEGKVLEPNEDGVVMLSNGEMANWDDAKGFRVYVRCSDIPGNNFTLRNLPEDAILVNGIPYVDMSHLHDFENDMSPGSK